MAHPDSSSFELIPKEHLYQDFEERQLRDHHWGPSFTEGDATLFATVAPRSTPLYRNVEYARAHDKEQKMGASCASSPLGSAERYHRLRGRPPGADRAPQPLGQGESCR